MTKSMTQFLPIRTAVPSLFVVLFSLVFNHAIKAQHRLGLANSNYGGITNLMSNPADMAGSRYKTYIGFGQIDGHLTNNYFKFGNLNLDFLGSSDSVSLLKKNGDYLSLGFDLAGLSVIQSITPQISAGLSYRVRGMGQGVGITQNLYNPLGLSNSDQVTDVKSAGLNVGGQLFSEIDLSYAHTLIDNDAYGLKLGLTAKKLTGAFATGVIINQLDAQYTKNRETEKYNITNGQLTVAYGGLGNLDSLTDFSPSDILGKKGQGWGFDLGATYEHRTTSFVNKDGTSPYLFRVGASLTDFGNIKYDGNSVRYYTANLKNVNLNSDSSDITNADELLKRAGVKLDSSVTSFKAAIPTMLRVNADVRLTDLFFVNVNWATNLVNRYKLGSQYASFIAVTPRLETRYFDFSLPLALTNNYKTFGMGFGMRIGFLTFGMDNFTGFAGSASGFNGHAGLNIGFGRRKDSKKLAAKEREKEKEAEVVEAKQQAQERDKERAKKKAKEASETAESKPKSSAPKAEEKAKESATKAPKIVETAKSSAPKVEEKAKESATKAPAIVETAKPSAPKVEEKAKESATKAPAIVETAKPSAPKVEEKVKESAAKAPVTIAAPKPSAPKVEEKAKESAAKAPATIAAPKPSTPKVEEKVKESAAKAPATVVKPKPVERTEVVTLSPLSSGKMGECIEFFPNKPVIMGNSTACLREISKFLMANKNVKLTVTGSILPTEKLTDAAALKLERAKTVRNYLIQSGVEATRLTIKTSDGTGVPIVLSGQ
jgi:outer membrane protein OmpA-like peptidoglycan-associated protein